MSFDRDSLKSLAIEFAACLPPEPARQVELIVSTGETLSREAMDIARFYEHSTPTQRAALDAVVRSYQ
jgi:hypothetical protein